MPTLTSRDGTAIACTRTRDGPPVVLVDGAFGSRAFGPNGAIAELLAQHRTVWTYDRRGRGESGDTAPYAVAREVEDLQAVVDAAGGRAAVFGISSDAALALEAARCGLPVTRLALFEAPFVVDDSRPRIPEDYLQQLDALVAADRRADAVRLFMVEAVGLPKVFVSLMRLMPAWSALKKAAHTVPYDARVLGDTGAGRPLPAGRWASVTAPTLVLVGGKSPTWMQHGMRALAAAVPGAELRTLAGQTHMVKAKALVPALEDFLRAGDARDRDRRDAVA